MNKKLIKGIFVFIVFGLILWAAVIIYFKFYYIDIYQDQNIDVFRIKLSNDDLDFFQEFSDLSLEKSYKIEELNDWRKAELEYNGKDYEIEVKIHGDSLNHFMNDLKSYRVKLKNGQEIKGTNQFSFILFSDRAYFPVISEYYSNFLDLYSLDYDLVFLSLNKGQYYPYFFREYKDKSFLDKNNLLKASYVKKMIDLEPVFDLLNFGKIRKGEHQTKLDHEFVYNSVYGNTVNEKKVNYDFYLLNKALEANNFEDIISFFDYDYLINYEVLKTLLLTPHDIAGDNQVFIYNDSNRKFYPMVAGEIGYPYEYGLIEAESNRELCTIEGINKLGGFISVFAQLNRNADYRQEKYKRLYGLIKNDQNLSDLKFIFERYEKKVDNIFLDKDLSIYNSINQNVPVMDNLLHNIDFLKKELSSSKILIFFEESSNGLHLRIAPISVSALQIQDFKLFFENYFNSNNEIKIVYKWKDQTETNEKVITSSKNYVDLSDIFFDYYLCLNVDEDFFPFVRELDLFIDYPNNTFYNFEVSINNLVTKESLNSEKDILFFDSKVDYDNALKDNFNYPKTENMFCETRITKDFFEKNELIKENLSFAKIFANVVQKENIVFIELMPMSLADLKFEGFLFNVNNLLPKGQQIKFSLYDTDENLLHSDVFQLDQLARSFDVANLLKNFSFNTERDDFFLFRKTKYLIVLEFLNLKSPVYIDSLDMTIQNIISNESINDDSIIYSIADGNESSLYLFDPEGTPPRIEREFKYSFLDGYNFKKYELIDLAYLVNDALKKGLDSKLWEAPDFAENEYFIDEEPESFLYFDIYFDTEDNLNYENGISYRLRERFKSFNDYEDYLDDPDNEDFWPYRIEFQAKVGREELGEGFSQVYESRFEFREDSEPFGEDNPPPEPPWDLNEFISYFQSGYYENYYLWPAKAVVDYLFPEKTDVNVLEFSPKLVLITERQRQHLNIKSPWGSGPNPEQAFIITLDKSYVYEAEEYLNYLYEKLGGFNNYEPQKRGEFSEIEVEFERNISTVIDDQMENNVKEAFLADQRTIMHIIKNKFMLMGIEIIPAKQSKYLQAYEFLQSKE